MLRHIYSPQNNRNFFILHKILLFLLLTPACSVLLCQILVSFSKWKVSPKAQRNFLWFRSAFLENFKKNAKTKRVEQSNGFMRNCKLQVICSNLNISSNGNVKDAVKNLFEEG
jgi:hypothetical protein